HRDGIDQAAWGRNQTIGRLKPEVAGLFIKITLVAGATNVFGVPGECPVIAGQRCTQVADQLGTTNDAVAVVVVKALGQARIEQLLEVFEHPGALVFKYKPAKGERVVITEVDINTPCLLTVNVQIAVINSFNLERLGRMVTGVAVKQIEEGGREVW